MRLARNELKIAVAAMCLLVLFAAVYLVIKLTSDNGTIVADSGDQPSVPVTDETGTEATDETEPVTVMDDEPVDPFETEPTVDPSEASSAWDELFAGGDSPTLMQTPGADGSEPQLAGDLGGGIELGDDDDVEPDLARLSAGTTDLPDTPADDVDDTPVPDFTGPRTYIVKQGDSFYTIARDQLGDANLYRAIEQANPLVDPRRIRPGMEIKLPDVSNLRSGNGTRAVAPEADLTIDGHVIKPGETLSDIALQHYGKSYLWRDIYEANRDKLESPNRLKVGVVLTIPELTE
ncbi:MAG: LysM domain-containing protein [Planctomycetota bacterium]